MKTWMRRNVAALLAVGALAFPAATLWGCAGIDEASAQQAASTSGGEAQKAASGAASEPIDYPAGSTITLDAGSEESAYDIGDGIERRVDFGWTGSMELSVTKAELIRGDAAASKEKELGLDLPADNDRLLLLTCRLRNIDAEPKNEDFTGKLAFSASVFHVPGTEARYFSAASAAPSAHEYLSFQLAPSEEMEFTLGYPWRSDKPGAPDESSLVLAPGADGSCGHIRLHLSPELSE